MHFTHMRVVILMANIMMIVQISFGQSQTYSHRDDYNDHILDRLDILNSQEEIFSSFKPYQREEILDASTIPGVSKSDEFNRKYLSLNNWEYSDSLDYQSRNPFLGTFYKSKSDLYHFRNKDLNIHVNPVFSFQIGSDGDTDEMLYTNTRGVEVRGSVDQKVSFYTSFTENQLRYPGYVRGYQLQNGVIPGLGFWKLLDENAYDFIFARGHISFNATKHINLQFGHDRFFIGNGYRSLLLSDFATNYPYFKIKTKVWKLQYTNVFAQLTADVGFFQGGTLGTDQFPKKFMAMHHLSINLSPNLNVGLFESIMFSRADSLGNNQFELNYLNPIILYRSVEQYTGSPDNAILGMDIKWNVANRLSFYGQFLIDEFIVSNVFGDKGNWTNKFSFQVGAKYLNVLNIDNLDLQVEYNFARPFTYTHESFNTNYAHYNQPLAHPLGANFEELIGIIRYQPIPRLFLRGRIITAEYGRDPAGMNLGGDILEPYDTRIEETGHFLGQGDNYKLAHVDFRASYQLKHNLFIDFNQTFRTLEFQPFGTFNTTKTNTSISSIGVRLNMASTDIVF